MLGFDEFEISLNGSDPLMLRFITPLPSTNFTPANLSGLSLWLDANDTTTFNAGSINDLDLVSSWKDKSSNAINYTQATMINQPVWHANANNSKGGVLFTSASSQILTGGTANSLLSPTSPFSIFIVIEQTLTVTFSGFMNFYSSTGNAVNFGGTSPYNLIAIGSGSSNFNPGVEWTGATVNNFVYYQVNFDGLGGAVGDWKVWTNTSSTSISASSSGSAGNANYVGGYPGGYMNGYLQEVVVLGGRNANASEVILMNTYIQNKYGL